MSSRILPLIALIALLCTSNLRAQTPVGSLSGQVLDAETYEPVIGAAVMLRGTTLGAAADLEGRFEILNIPVGSYVVHFSAIGYEPFAQTDIVVRSGRATPLKIELKVLAINTGEVTIRPGYFKQTVDEPLGTVELSYEEIRRAPGAAGDVSRVIMQLPSVAKVNDTRNSLVVRGGSPAENGYKIDGIEVPNINHFPLQGAASGALGMVNVNLIDNVAFQAGGFGAQYGDKLSSYMELGLREGNRETLQAQANMSFLSAGAVLEGPLANHNGSWLLSANRSYFDFIINAFDVEASAIPWYSDVLTKVSLDVSSKSRFTFIDLLGIDHSHIARSLALDNEENVYGTADWRVNTLGVSWRYLWNGGRGYSVTSLAHTYSNWTSAWSEAVTENKLSRNESDENTLRFHNENFFRVGRHNFSFGAAAEVLPYSYDRTFFATTDPFGNTSPELNITQSSTASKVGAFATLHLNITDKWIASPGVRADYSDYTTNSTVSPRLQVSYQASRATAFTASTGLYHQTLPLVLLSQSPSFKELQDPLAVHYVLGVSQLLTDDTRLTLEGYHKDYDKLPVDPWQPRASIIDQTNDQDGYTAHEALIDVGHAYSTGVEAMLQKKLVENLYGSISGSYFRSRYRNDSVWRDRIYDNRYLFTVTGGYKPSLKWELSMRWVFAGGAPYTPFDIAQSTAENRAILDDNKVNSERLPDYHTLDVRVDRRFNLANSNWILFLSIQNLYGRENIASHYWNQVQNKPDTYKQWGTLPILGVEFEF